MEFYLNQKSLPMIRKCANCISYNQHYKSCNLLVITNAYDHNKKIYLTTGDNSYCPNHEFTNENILKESAVITEFNTIKEAMKVIEQYKENKNINNII